MRKMFSEKQIENLAKTKIESGNLNINGNFTANSIIENMSGYSFAPGTSTHRTFDNWYAGVVKTGNKITFVISVDVTQLDSSDLNAVFGEFTIPSAVGQKLVPSNVGGYDYIDNRQLQLFSAGNTLKDCPAYITKPSNTKVRFVISLSALTVNTVYHARYEATFLLSDNLAS